MINESASPVVLALDKNRRNLELLHKFLERHHYSVVALTEPEKVRELIHAESEIEVALIDIGGYDRRIWDTCEYIRNQNIPFIVISPQLTDLITQSSYQSGASNVLKKPLQIKQLLNLIASFAGEANG